MIRGGNLLIIDNMRFFMGYNWLSGTPHLHEYDIPPAGGKPGWAAPPNPRIGPWLRHLRTIAESHKLIPEFEVAQMLCSCIYFHFFESLKQNLFSYHELMLP